jgi:hypothetical protein
MNRVDWLKNYVVKMASGSVKCGDDLQIFTMNKVVFGAYSYFLFNYFEGKHVFGEVEY